MCKVEMHWLAHRNIYQVTGPLNRGYFPLPFLLPFCAEKGGKMENKRKKTLFNVIMVVLILIIAGCGIMAVGNLKGWFDKGSDSVLVTKEVKGVASIQRQGVGYGLEKNVALRAGDILETKNGTTAVISAGEKNILSLNANTKLTAESVEKNSLKLTADQGEILADFGSPMGKAELSFEENGITFETGVFSVSAQTGSGVVYVFKDEITLDDGDGNSTTVKAGESVQMTKDEDGNWKTETGKISAASLNEYMIRQLMECEDKDNLCFTVDELQKVLDDRAAEKKKALEKSLTSANKIPKSSSESSDKKNTGKSDASKAETDTADGSTGENTVQEYTPEDSNSQNETDGSEENVQDDSNGEISDDGTDGNTEDESGEDTGTGQCTITIRCDTILNNMDNLTAGKEAYVPANGVILDTSTVEFTEGETVFDVLQRVCDYAGIQLEYSWTPMYDSYYIQGINNLYEFDCGAQSGWMFKVNGWFPNYGCSKYTLEDGDDIVWCFTCNGLGEDVGAQ